jgi:hydrogenase maturation factor
MNGKLPDDTLVKCKRRGLKVTLTVGAKKGDGIMRRLQISKDPVLMLDAALKEAAKNAGVELSVEENQIFISTGS